MPERTQPVTMQRLDASHVNIRDFLECPNPEAPVRLFKSEEALRKYTKENRRTYPLSGVPKGSVLRCLLRHIFSIPLKVRAVPEGQGDRPKDAPPSATLVSDGL